MNMKGGYSFDDYESLVKEKKANITEFLTLRTLLKIGLDSDAVTDSDFPSTDELFKDKDGNTLENISVYNGINRSIFRKGVALTSKALQQKSMGRDPYDKLWDEHGIAQVVSAFGFVFGSISLIAGAVMVGKTSKELNRLMDIVNSPLVHGDGYPWEFEIGVLDQFEAEQGIQSLKPVNTAGKWLMGIGGALIIAAAVLQGYELYKHYHRDFSIIPRMIVDEADIVSYTTDDKGNQQKNINFDHFDYYEIVRCNRQEIGIHKNAQNGVSDYQSWGCGDFADLNADVGIQWLALYVNKAGEKGKPILADLLTLLSGKNSEKMPSDCNGNLHMFTFENAVKLDDEAYSYRDTDGMYFYWKTDEAAYTASAFNGGYLALAGIGGLALGILGTTLVLLPKIKKKKEEEAA